jgi:hypothetical protein
MATLLIPEVGCFVYKVVDPNGVTVRCTKDGEEKSKFHFSHEQLFEVDLMDGSDLRLADGSGWITEKKEGINVCQEINVDDGLWKFHAFCTTGSMFLHKHPTDRPDLRLKPILWPLQKVYCDKRVKSPSGMAFYRIQGNNAWVYSRRHGIVCLYPELMVSTELKVFSALEVLSVRSEPTVDATKTTGRKIRPGSLVAVDHTIIMENDKGNGPFLRLADDSGWLFVSIENKTVMEEAAVQRGEWEFVVENAPVPLTLMADPVDTDDYFAKTKTEYDPFEHIFCDKQVQSPSGAVFYRVNDTKGWIPDRRFTKNEHIIQPGETVEHSTLALISFNKEPPRSSMSYDSGASDEEEETLRSALRKLERDYSEQRNKMLQKIHEIDMKHTVKSYRRVKDQAIRIDDLAAVKAGLDDEIAKSIAKQLEVFHRRSESERTRKNRGDMFEAEICHEDEIKFARSDLMFAMGGTATLALNESRIPRYTSGLASDLFSLFELETALPLASYVALGSEDRYFVRFANNPMERWCVKNEELEIILLRETVEFVAFGAGCRSYVAKTSTDIYYDSIPMELEEIIQEDRPIHSISLGPNGEYFVAWKDGACTGGNWLGAKISEALARLKREGCHIRDIKFGDDSAFVIRHSDYDGPF